MDVSKKYRDFETTLKHHDKSPIELGLRIDT